MLLWWHCHCSLCACVCVSCTPFLSSSSSHSVSQPLLIESMLGNSSLEFPWTCSRPPFSSLLPLTPTVLSCFSPSHPPASPSLHWVFHKGAMCVCVSVCASIDYSQQTTTLKTASRPFFHWPLRCDLSVKPVCSFGVCACCRSSSWHHLWLIFSTSLFWKWERLAFQNCSICVCGQIQSQFHHHDRHHPTHLCNDS